MSDVSIYIVWLTDLVIGLTICLSTKRNSKSAYFSKKYFQYDRKWKIPCVMNIDKVAGHAL